MKTFWGLFLVFGLPVLLMLIGWSWLAVLWLWVLLLAQYRGYQSHLVKVQPLTREELEQLVVIDRNPN